VESDDRKLAHVAQTGLAVGATLRGVCRVCRAPYRSGSRIIVDNNDISIERDDVVDPDSANGTLPSDCAACGFEYTIARSRCMHSEGGYLAALRIKHHITDTSDRRKRRGIHHLPME
jgi:hypothetical protein